MRSLPVCSGRQKTQLKRLILYSVKYKSNTIVRKITADFQFNLIKTADGPLSAKSRFWFKFYLFYILFLLLSWLINNGRCEEQDFPPPGGGKSAMIRSTCAGSVKPSFEPIDPAVFSFFPAGSCKPHPGV